MRVGRAGAGARDGEGGTWRGAERGTGPNCPSKLLETCSHMGCALPALWLFALIVTSLSTSRLGMSTPKVQRAGWCLEIFGPGKVPEIHIR